jgi:hypothetical protein
MKTVVRILNILHKFILDFYVFLCENRNNDLYVEIWVFRKDTAMASEQVNRILEAEKKASEIEQEARVKSDEILANAQKQAQKDYQEALSEARKKVASLYEKHKEDGSSSNTANDAASEKAAEKLRDAAEPNREAAISAAMNILMGRK